ncbi:hypothetical protein HK102_012317 [Quaeritorhiza haematococci]|nr:hypothetical protein HK102_012317 [Quaeritorhiza haematococci]
MTTDSRSSTPQLPNKANGHIRKRTFDPLNDLDDVRIVHIKPLIPPAILMEDYPLTEAASATVSRARHEGHQVIKGADDRLLVVIGPCSIHDDQAALDYGRKLKDFVRSNNLDKDLVVIMRVYFEKPRTTVGWKGLINDPNLDGTFAINKGLKKARSLLLALNDLGLPTGCEFLDTLTPQYIGDLVSWGAIGARTTESQVHRELASGLSVPVGFKNGTDGNVRIAIDAIRAASASHHFLSVTKQGVSAIVETSGNESCHVILRGANSGPNYSSEHVAEVAKQLEAAQLAGLVMVDCSHGNSQKKHKNQIQVVKSISEQLASGSTASNIMGVMIESHLKEGRQNIPPEGPSGLVYGQSITDACIGWEDTESVLKTLAEGVRQRRAHQAAAAQQQ